MNDGPLGDPMAKRFDTLTSATEEASLLAPSLIHEMRQRIIESPCFGNGKVIGAILFEKTMDGTSGGKSVPHRLAERGIVPFLKVDKGLEDERDGAQLMKPHAGLEDMCNRARELGVFGTKMRSVITGVAAW